MEPSKEKVEVALDRFKAILLRVHAVVDEGAPAMATSVIAAYEEGVGRADFTRPPIASQAPDPRHLRRDVQRREGADDVDIGRQQGLNVEARPPCRPDVHRDKSGLADIRSRSGEQADSRSQLRQSTSKIDDRPLSAAIALHRQPVGEEEGHVHGAVS